MSAQEALDHQIIRVTVGSSVHGLAVDGASDRDEMGVFIEDPSRVFGVRAPLPSHVSRTKPEGARSGAGDLDLALYSLRHFVNLALAGNPSILTLLFTPDSDVLLRTDIGDDLLSTRDAIVSAQAGPRFLGYLHGQRDRMVGGGKQSRVPNRPELVEKYGFDVKYASHALRLGLQGVELLTAGSLSLPMSQPDRDLVLAVKTGRFTFTQALAMVDDVAARLKSLVYENRPGVLRDKPNLSAVAAFSHRAHATHWAQQATP